MLLEKMMADMEKAPEIYRPTRFWASCVPHIVRDIEEYGIEQFRSHQSGLAYYVPSYGDLNYLRDKSNYEAELDRLGKLQPELANAWRNKITGYGEALMDYHIFRAADTDVAPNLSEVSQSTYGSPAEHFVFEGRTYGAAFLRYLKCLVFLKKKVKAHRVRKVLEIGGGYGVLGEILLKSQGRPYFYLDVDIPPVAYVATNYLQTVFGEAAVADYHVTRDMETIDVDDLQARGYRAAVLCPWQLERVKGSFELFMNSASFQEMEPEVTANYATQVARLVTDFLLLKNSRHGKPMATEQSIGVIQPTTRKHYLEAFSDFDLVAMDAATFGIDYGGFASEVMVFQRKRRSA